MPLARAPMQQGEPLGLSQRGGRASSYVGESTKATSSMKHQLQSSPASAERTIGWPLSALCALACLFGDESQQPIFPQVMHIRRCTQALPIFRHSSQPAIFSGSEIGRAHV